MGWAKEFLIRQESGLTGHPEESGFPFNTGMWTEEMDYTDREFAGGSGWWPYEQTAYYIDGALRCGYMIGSDALVNRAQENINYVLKHRDEKGVFHAGNVKDDWWPLVVFMRILFEEYQVTGDAELLASIEKHYQSVYSKAESFHIPEGAGFSVRSLLHIEHLCNLYDITKNPWYLEMAEKLYGEFQQSAEDSKDKQVLQLTAAGMAQGIVPTGHAVTYHMFLQLPAMLYYHTQKPEYRIALERAYEVLQESHELSSGLSSGVEGFQGKEVNMAHELCNVIDFNWVCGWAMLATGDAQYADKMEKVLYNAGFSSVTSDFKAHQYYGAPNLPISGNMSSFYNDDTGWGFGAKGRMCYRPGHDTECCSGNVHRMFPTFLNRAAMVEPDGVKLVFYLPSSIEVAIDNETLKFTQETNYPFKHSIKITFDQAPSKEINFGLRIPGWANAYTIALNGKTIKKGTENTFFENIHCNFKKGDILDVAFKTRTVIDNRDKGISLMYGPLVFSYPIEARQRMTTSDDGKKSSLSFPAYEFSPRYPNNWAFSISKHIQYSDVEIIETEQRYYPWDYGKSPLKLKVSARPVKNWKLKDNVAASVFPDSLELEMENKTLILEPMGATLLRISEFPMGDF